jgi:hypothetical protein
MATIGGIPQRGARAPGTPAVKYASSSRVSGVQASDSMSDSPAVSWSDFAPAPVCAERDITAEAIASVTGKPTFDQGD